MQSNKNKSYAYGTNSIDPHQWVIRYADYLYTFANRRINDQDQARDLVQDTFLSALEKIDNFEGRCSEKTWLTSILKNKVIDIYRKRSPVLINTIDIFDDEPEHPEFFEASNGRWKVSYRDMPADNYEADPVVSKEFAVALQRCIQKLPALWLSVFSMKYRDDQSTKSICRELKVTPSNVWTIIHRTKNRLRSSLQKLEII